MGKEAGSTIRAKIAAVKNLVTSKGFGWHGRNRLRGVLSIERATPASSFRPERVTMAQRSLVTFLTHSKLQKCKTSSSANQKGILEVLQWSRSGIKCITGYSFRIGGTTHYLTGGIPPDIVMGR
ncbi:hypothetical protein F5876DRAFT_71086 [Lentinula aff. lateritia]|uniref:Uncharacterized protein n=1 Tax=Lentinula aff. lateritia TaxID=2804960 RepID=A0ACC1TGM9_9AGAR|nr:hypothetical protein F5876DRAFT_71086 [Lentinula aff. lateritia]